MDTTFFATVEEVDVLGNGLRAEGGVARPSTASHWDMGEVWVVPNYNTNKATEDILQNIPSLHEQRNSRLHLIRNRHLIHRSVEKQGPAPTCNCGLGCAQRIKLTIQSVETQCSQPILMSPLRFDLV